jgi:hypothetical protein
MFKHVLRRRLCQATKVPEILSGGAVGCKGGMAMPQDVRYNRLDPTRRATHHKVRAGGSGAGMA